MLSPTERQQIIAEIRNWAARVPPERGFGFLQDRELMTPSEIQQAVEKEAPEGKAILRIIEHNLRRTSLGDVLFRIRTLPTVERSR